MQNIYTVYDTKAKYYMPPFNFRNHAEAIRAFADTANDPRSGIGKHPEDYILFFVGTFDEQTGRISHQDHHNLAKAIELLDQEPQRGLFESLSTGALEPELKAVSDNT